MNKGEVDVVEDRLEWQRITTRSGWKNSMRWRKKSKRRVVCGDRENCVCLTGNAAI